jgi:DNA-binding response OmpR family regulator
MSTTKQKLTVAVIEDEPTICEMYRFKLEQAGYRAVTARDGQEGMVVCRKEKPELILLDLLMPIMTGDEMLARLRATELGSKVKVVILTNLSKDEAPPVLRLLHVDRYIVKAHYTPSQVVELVKEVLGEK